MIERRVNCAAAAYIRIGNFLRYFYGLFEKMP